MKTNAFRIALLTAAFLIAASVSLQAAPSLPITEPPVSSTYLDGPNIDPTTINGQWFTNLVTGNEAYRTHEFYDNVYDHGGGNYDYTAIQGYVTTVQLGGGGVGWTDPIIGFTIDATIQNDTSSAFGQESDGSNSHEEFRAAGEERYVGTLVDTKLTAEFAIADLNLLPLAFIGPYQEQYPYIIAENEDQWAWYCWNEQETQAPGGSGNYYVPTWDFGDIAVGSSMTKTLVFSVDPPMDPTDPRYAVIYDSIEQDVFANRTTSLKISTWMDTIAIDTGIPYFEEEPLRSSDVSVFHNFEDEPGDEFDFGDAPDPLMATPGEYPTLLANNGARHMIVAGAPWFGDLTWSETDMPDGEPDGQPDPNALGDDINGTTPDDEDGIVIPVLTPGFSSSITINVGQPGWVDGWIDWNADGKWGAAERVIGQVLPAGANNFIVTAPNGATVGFTFARFRIHTADGIALGSTGDPTQYGATDDGEVEDHLVEIVEGPYATAKWLQPPDLTPNGFDVACRREGQPPILLADDFLCTQTGPITNIIVWGSWLDDILPEGSPSNVTFTLSFHADIPKGVVTNWSMPGDLLWMTNFTIGQFSAEPITFDGMQEGWYDPAEPYYTPIGDTVCWQYTFPVDITNAFVQTGTSNNPVVYWLDVQAQSHDEQAHFGWKTTPPEYRWNDDAAWTPNVEYYNGLDWRDLHYPPGHPYEEWETNSFDLAFALFGGEEIEEFDWGDVTDSGNYPAFTYRTLAWNGGANHLIVPGILMGNSIDPETDGQPNATATGDDNDGNDDEDGVVFQSLLIPGQNSAIDVTVSVAGWLDVWLDADNSFDWTGPNDLIYSGTVNPGLNSLTIPLPAGISAGQNYMRFRYNTVGALTPGGNASDGEVEDYTVDVEELDWGDAPDTPYPTLAASSGANHLIGSSLYLGTAIDAEPDGQPAADAKGDDTDAGGDDEDGITFKTPFFPGTVAQIDVTAFGSGLLNIWIDFNVNGSWLDAGEQVYTDHSLSSGTTTLAIPVPAGLIATNTCMRVRYSSVQSLQPTGYASDGEVEDYLIAIEEELPIDWGDLPSGYPVLAANNGAHHILSSSLCLGTTVDSEPDGQQTINADGDDTNLLYPGIPYPPGDEDGVVQTCSALMPGGYASVDVIASQPGTLDAWIDFNLDTGWTQTGDQIFSNQPLVQGTNSLLFPVPLTASTGIPAHCRFRITSGSAAYPGGSASPTGLAYDGEVEDYHWLISAVPSGSDWGDAPDAPYPTWNASLGAAHTILAGVMLGATVDAETNGIPTAAADGDDTTGIDDEDGVTFASEIVAGTNATVEVVAGVSGGYLDAWIDFNADGDWIDAGEQIVTATLLSAGLNTLSISVPQPSALGPTCARFRITSGSGGLNPDNAGLPPLMYPDGEVEDYRINLYQPQTATDILITNITVTLSNDLAKIEWTAENNITYQMQSSSNLLTNIWTDVGGEVIGPVNWQTNSAAPTQQFYRITAPWTL
jgi:hypothetical protein